MNWIFIFVLTFFCSEVWATEPPAHFTYQGKVYDSSNNPLTDSAVTFKIQIFSPDSSCLLFEETHLRNMTGTDGIFALNVGEGSNTGATALTLKQVLNNSSAMTGASSCSYTPTSGDARQLVMGYVAISDSQPLVTSQSIQSVPFAINAVNLQGLGKSDFIQVSPQVTQTKANSLFQYYAQLLALGNGTSGVYGKSTELGGQVLNLTGLAANKTLVWNSVSNEWQTANLPAGTVTSVTAGTGLTGGTITTSGTLAVNVGTSANQIVQLDGSARLPAVNASQLVGLPTPFSNMQVFSNAGSTSWTVPSNVTKVFVQVWGGGGGGGGGSAASIGGSGGGAGGYGADFLTVTPSASISVIVGSGGSAGSSGGNGTAGGSSSFGSLSATGGSAGQSTGQQPVAGGTSSASINISGGTGSAASGFVVVSLGGSGGTAGGGGGSGGGGSSVGSTPGAAGAAPGGGGGGGGNGALSAASGGAGGTGRVIVWY